MQTRADKSIQTRADKSTQTRADKTYTHQGRQNVHKPEQTKRTQTRADKTYTTRYTNQSRQDSHAVTSNPISRQ